MDSAKIAACAVGAILTMACAARAEPWVDYTPAKGVWDKTYVHVEPSRIDDYMVALKKTWVPEQESAKKHGLIDQYIVQIAVNSATTEPNVMLGVHYVSMAVLDPDKARDMAMEKEFDQMMPKAAATTEQDVRAKYRTTVREEMWSSVEFTK